MAREPKSKRPRMPESPGGGATGHALESQREEGRFQGRGMAETRPIKVPSGNAANSGALVRHPKGSNGGVHRGPDKFPRANVMRAIMLRALTVPGFRVEDLPATLAELRKKRRHRKGRSLVDMAGAEQMVRGLQNIMEEAAIGHQDAYGLLIRLFKEMHVVLTTPTNGKHGSGHSSGAPFASSFVPQDPEPAAAPAPPAAPEGVPIVVDGTEYVEGCA